MFDVGGKHTRNLHVGHHLVVDGAPVYTWVCGVDGSVGRVESILRAQSSQAKPSHGPVVFAPVGALLLREDARQRVREREGERDLVLPRRQLFLSSGVGWVIIIRVH